MKRTRDKATEQEDSNPNYQASKQDNRDESAELSNPSSTSLQREQEERSQPAREVASEDAIEFANSIKENMLSQLEKQSQHFNRRLQEMENRLVEMDYEKIQKDLQVMNDVAKNINFIEGKLEERLAETEEFFKNLPFQESMRGQLGVYEDIKRQLSRDFQTFTLVTAEIGHQRLLWNELIQRFKQENS